MKIARIDFEQGSNFGEIYLECEQCGKEIRFKRDITNEVFVSILKGLVCEECGESTLSLEEANIAYGD